MYLIVGLGNPGAKYRFNRHNIGFMAIDIFVGSDRLSNFKNDFKSEIIKLKTQIDEFVCLKPQTFMNLSGDAVLAASQFYKIPHDKIIVIHDEIDQPFGKIKIQKNRGHGGHNGIRDISLKLGTPDYIRVRLGVGRPENPNIPVADYVLQNFLPSEQNTLDDLLKESTKAVESIILDGYQKAANQFNQ